MLCDTSLHATYLRANHSYVIAYTYLLCEDAMDGSTKLSTMLKSKLRKKYLTDPLGYIDTDLIMLLCELEVVNYN